MRNASHFQGRFGGGSTFTCPCCKRRTRMTTQLDEDFCAECEELCMMQNGLWDNGAEEFNKYDGAKYRDQFLAKIVKLGGDKEAVIAYLPDLFGKGRYSTVPGAGL